MNEPIRTFSGAHPYRPQCAVATARVIFREEIASIAPDLTGKAAEWSAGIAERITKAIDANVCPRCSDPLRPDPTPDGWRPAGSRATRCRCIPVCDTCASWAEPFLGILAITAWPTDLDDGDDRTHKEIEAELIEQIKAKCSPGGILAAGPGGTVRVTPEGVAPVNVQLRPNPGGWLEFGYDDTDDERERQS